MSKVYAAAPWVDREKMSIRAEILEDAGHTLTHKWWLYEGSEEETTPEFMHKCAVQDLNGVVAADVLIVFQTAKSEGKATEQGIALGLGIPIISVGKRGQHTSNIFHYLNDEHGFWWVETLDEALHLIGDILHER